MCVWNSLAVIWILKIIKTYALLCRNRNSVTIKILLYKVDITTTYIING